MTSFFFPFQLREIYCGVATITLEIVDKCCEIPRGGPETCVDHRQFIGVHHMSLLNNEHVGMPPYVFILLFAILIYDIYHNFPCDLSP